MIIGSGLIASILNNIRRDSSIAYFASGVSCSSETRVSEFLRERKFLEEVLIKHERVVYFSSCFAGLPRSKHNLYLRHKVDMEKIVLSFPKTSVLRLPNIVKYGGNKNNLINKLINHIRSGEQFEICPQANRNLVDANMLSIFIHDFENNYDRKRIQNVCSPFTYRLEEIVLQIEEVIDKKALYRSVKETPFNFSTSQQLLEYGKDAGITKRTYLEAIINQYVQ
jgi:hypothetical protein